MKENMGLWNRHSKTNEKNIKKVEYGSRKFSAIDAYSQIKNATEEWGPFGDRWGIKDEEYIIIDEKLFICLYRAILYYPGEEVRAELPISSDIEVILINGKNKGQYNSDWSKKVKTDALTKGLSYLGYNADVFLGEFDDNKYVQQERKNKINFDEIKNKLKSIQNEAGLNDYYVHLKSSFVSEKQKDTVAGFFADRKQEILTDKIEDIKF